MKQVSWTAQHEYEFTKNYKVLQRGFQKVGLKKAIPVLRLVKARMNDNLEFGNWMRKYYLANVYEKDYDPEKARSKF